MQRDKIREHTQNLSHAMLIAVAQTSKLWGRQGRRGGILSSESDGGALAEKWPLNWSVCVCACVCVCVQK